MDYLSNNGIIYAVRYLLEFAGVGLENVHITFNDWSQNPSVDVNLINNKHIIFKILKPFEIRRLISGELPDIRIYSFDNSVEVPIFPTSNCKSFATIDQNSLIINPDIVIPSFIMLARYEEIIIQERDQFNRFEYKNSIAEKYNFIDIPIVDEYAMLLRMSLLKYIPKFHLNKKVSKVIPTHDVDFLIRFSSLLRNFKTIIGGDLLIRKNLLIAFKSIHECIISINDPKKDPFLTAIQRLSEISKDARLSSIFYFKGLRNGQYDSTYDISAPEVKYAMGIIKEMGMTLGMHGSLESYNDGNVFRREKESIEAIWNRKISLVRQHFLLFDVRKTLQIWQSNGITNDSSLGYAEREGFRCGTCHEYYLYNLIDDHISTVKENPLIVMDVTLFEYRRFNLETAINRIDKLFNRCKAVEGNFTILWHNNNLTS